jgi:hypothetical protein
LRLAHLPILHDPVILCLRGSLCLRLLVLPADCLVRASSMANGKWQHGKQHTTQPFVLSFHVDVGKDGRDL